MTWASKLPKSRTYKILNFAQSVLRDQKLVLGGCHSLYQIMLQSQWCGSETFNLVLGVNLQSLDLSPCSACAETPNTIFRKCKLPWQRLLQHQRCETKIIKNLNVPIFKTFCVLSLCWDANNALLKVSLKILYEMDDLGIETAHADLFSKFRVCSARAETKETVLARSRVPYTTPLQKWWFCPRNLQPQKFPVWYFLYAQSVLRPYRNNNDSVSKTWPHWVVCLNSQRVPPRGRQGASQKQVPHFWPLLVERVHKLLNKLFLCWEGPMASRRGTPFPRSRFPDGEQQLANGSPLFHCACDKCMNWCSKFRCVGQYLEIACSDAALLTIPHCQYQKYD